MIECMRPDTPCEFRARQAEKIVQVSQTHALQRDDCLRIETTGSEGHAAERVREQRDGGDCDPVCMRREHACASRSRCCGERKRESKRIELTAQSSFQRGPSSEQSKACADFDEYGIGRGDGDVGTEAIGPGSNRLKRLALRCCIARRCIEARTQHLRRRQRLTGAHARHFRGRIGEHDVPAL